MTTANKKRLRISSPCSDSDDVDEGNPKTKAGDTGIGVKSNTCFVCDKKDNLVLLCNGDECPLAIHQSCTSDEPDFDEFGNFYCPYCWYKRVVLKHQKKKLIVTDKSQEPEEIENINDSGGGRLASENLGENRKEVDESYERFLVMEKNQRMNEVAGGSQSQEVYKSGEKRKKQQRRCNRNLETAEAHSGSCPREARRTRRRLLRDSELGNGRHVKKNKHNKTVETETLAKEVSKDEERKREGAMEKDVDDFCFVENQDGQCQANMRNAEETVNDQVERNSVVPSISSPMSTDKSNAIGQELALIIHPMAGLLGQPIDARPYLSVSSKTPSLQPRHKSNMEKKGASASTDRGQRSFVLCSDKKRKRLFWTEEEEEMLWVGVQKFPCVRNIPWRKILAYGRDVFHKERLPSDLKDKWKKMNKMLPSESGKLVSISSERQQNQSVSE